MSYIAYLVKCSCSGKCYIGITSRPLAERWRQHCVKARKGTNRGLAGAIMKYGYKAFTIEQAGFADTVEELFALEHALILKYSTFAPKGYNLTMGGEGTPGHRQSFTPEWRARISAAKKRQGVSEATRMAQRAGGWKLPARTLATRERISANMRAWWRAFKEAGGTTLYRPTPTTYCRRGHLLDEGNTRVRTNGHRQCRLCSRFKERQNYDPAKRQQKWLRQRDFENQKAGV